MRFFLLAMISAASASTAPSRAASLQQRGLPRLGLGMAALGRPGYINLGHATDLPEERKTPLLAELLLHTLRRLERCGCGCLERRS